MTDTTTPDFDPFNPSNWADEEASPANQSNDAHDAEFDGIVQGQMEDALEDVIAEVESEDASSSSTTEETPEEAPEGEEEAKQEPDNGKKKYVFNVKGEQVEIELDEAELLAKISHAHRAEEALQTAARDRQNLETLMKTVQKDPSELFRFLKIDPVDWSERYLGSHLENLSMSPEERQARQDQIELQLYRQEQERLQQEQQTQQQEQAKAAATQRLEADIVSAIERAPGLSKDPVVRTQTLLDVNRFLAADKAKAYRENREPTLTPEMAVKRAMDARQREIKEMFKNMKDDSALYDFIGKETMTRLRKKDVENVKKFPTNRVSSNNIQPKAQFKDKNPLTNMADFDKWARNIKD